MKTRANFAILVVNFAIITKGFGGDIGRFLDELYRLIFVGFLAIEPEEKIMSPSFPQARQNELVVQDMPDEVLVYDLASNKAHCLNETSANIWKACDGTKSVAEIARILESDHGGKVSEDLVWLAIDQLNEKDLLISKTNSPFAGQSRRDVIKKIGLASVVLLPVIASLVAPPNALASLSCACTSPANCAPKSGCGSTTSCNTTVSGGQCQT